MGKEQEEDFIQKKRMLTGKPFWDTTRRTKKRKNGLGITLWQKQEP